MPTNIQINWITRFHRANRIGILGKKYRIIREAYYKTSWIDFVTGCEKIKLLLWWNLQSFSHYVFVFLVYISLLSSLLAFFSSVLLQDNKASLYSSNLPAIRIDIRHISRETVPFKVNQSATHKPYKYNYIKQITKSKNIGRTHKGHLRTSYLVLNGCSISLFIAQVIGPATSVSCQNCGQV